jgi:hypothetical protein
MELPEPALSLTREYENLKIALFQFIVQGGTIKSPCLCGGAKQYNNCHGKLLHEKLRNDLNTVEKAFRPRG